MRPRAQFRGRERGAALAVTLIAITALLGLGALTVLSVRTELSSSGQSRFNQVALYAAESGASAGMEFLRTNCNPTTRCSAWVSANNSNPPSPTGIFGNGIQPGRSGNPFATDSQLWYQVSILNNIEDEGFATGIDNDWTVIIRSIGFGPSGTIATVEMEVQNSTFLAAFCAREYAQRNVTSMNDANAGACAPRVGSGTLRTITP